MHAQNMAIVKSLVSVAWADGTFANAEKEMVDALIAAFEASDEQATEIREYAGQKRTIADIPFDELSGDDCRLLLNHAVFLTYVDGEQHEAETKFIGEMCNVMGMPEEEAKTIIDLAEKRAKGFLNLL